MREQLLEVLKDFNEELIEDFNKDLFVEGILDSYDLIKLITELEIKLGIEIDFEEITADNFRTTNTIINLIENIKK